MLTKIHVIVILLVTAVIPFNGQQTASFPQPWPPPVQPVANESRPLPPAAAMKTFSMPPGYSVELVASEPLVQDPVAIDWDPAGRLWVVEMPGYMRTITGANARDRVGRVIVLQDKDGDGAMDTRTVFADGLVLARAVKVLDRGVLVGEPPNVWLMRDTNGDLRMDTKELVTDQYGRLETDPQNNANAFHWALDNWMHVASHDITLRLTNGAFEVRRTLRRGQWGVTHDDAGRVYRNTNESALHVDLVPAAAYARNPNLLRTRGVYERLADENPELNIAWPVRPTPATNRAYQSGILRADGSLARFTAVCAPVVYRGDRLPADLYGNVFVAEPAANFVSRLVLDDDGTTVRARKAYERGEFLASTDERFRPVYLSNAPDGTLYVVDMYRGILEDRLSMTQYLRDQILSRRLEQPVGLGRIYRVVHETTRRDTPQAVATAPPAQLVAALAHPNGWWRDNAQRLIVERRPASVTPALVKLAETTADWRVRLHALWTLDGIDAIEPPMVARALDDASPHVRAAAVRLAERWLGEPNHPLQRAVLGRLHDAAGTVRRQLAASIGSLPPGDREAAVVSLLDAHAEDPVTLDAALSGLRGAEAAVLARMMQAGARHTAQREISISMLGATIVRGAQEAAIHDLFASVGTGSAAAAEWQRSALLRGMEIALLGAAMPGSPAPRTVVRETTTPPPCPTCPGGRGGPGGAYAYARPAAPPAGRGASAAGRGGARLRLNREPVPLTTLAATDSLAPRVTAVLARVSWPGKPGDSGPLAPLSPDEQRRFDAGREIYKNICQACHQADGRGQDKLAPSLIGASFTLGPAGIPTRILLNGKEGTFGLMPPIGAALSDDQIASVLTYVRREWGQGAAAVDAGTVKAVRALSTGRTRPWTDDELIKLERKE